MPTKKKTTTAVKKTTRKSTAARKATPTTTKATPTGHNRTTKQINACPMNNKSMMMLLLAINTILLILLVTAFNPQKSFENMEAQRVGGRENYELIQEIYELDNFKQQQRFQIEQTLQALQGNQQGNIMPNPQDMDPEAQIEIQAE